jgi:hypothetical protein
LSRALLIVLGAVFAAFLPLQAHAHGSVSGIGGFYGGLLHPLLVPAELLSVIATGLLLGTAGREACRLGLIAFAAGVAAGLAAARYLAPSVELTTSLALLMGLVAGMAVAAGIRVPIGLAFLVAAAAGLAIGIDAAPEESTFPTLLLASIATVLGSTVLVLLTAVLALSRNVHWQRIAVRIAGSWIAACAILYFSWELRVLMAH